MLQSVKQLNTVDKENVISFIAIFAPVATRVCLVGVVVVKSAVLRWSLTPFSCCNSVLPVYCNGAKLRQFHIVVFFFCFNP
jgi:hypothetical protein